MSGDSALQMLEEEMLKRGLILKPTLQNTLLRIARRVAQGFEGKVHLVIAGGGVRTVEWVEVETGDKIREELG